MDRHLRNLIHKKQERSKIAVGKPNLADMEEGILELRWIGQEGLVLYVRYQNKLWRTRFDLEGSTSIGVTIEV